MLNFYKFSFIYPIFIFSSYFLLGFGVSIALAELPPSALVDTEGKRYISIEKAQSEISIDGSLDDEDWENATFQKHFLQREPTYGEETSEDTQIALLKDEDNLYIGIKCYDSSSPEIIAKADVLIITGVTLLNHTLEEILQAAGPHAEIAVIGPTASLLPEALFQRGVRVVGGVWVQKPDELLDVLAAGGSGYHFFDDLAARIVIENKALGNSAGII